MKWLGLFPFFFCQLPAVNSQFFVEGAPIVATAYLNNQDFVGSIRTETSSTSIHSAFDIKKFNCHWQAGGRAAIGYAPCCDDSLFFKLEGTYLPNNHRKTFCEKTKFTSSVLSYLVPLWNQAFAGNAAEKAIAEWRLNFATLDLLAATKVCTASRVNLFPYIGLRGLWLEKTFNVEYRKTLYITNNRAPSTLNLAKTHLNDLNRALGITGGAQFDAPLFCRLNLFGKFGGSVLVGRLRVHENISGGGLSPDSTFPISAVLSEKNTAWTTNVESELGLRYQFTCYNAGISVSYFNSYWFDQNRLRALAYTGNAISASNEINYATLIPTSGAVGLQGVAFQLNFGF